MSSARPAPCHPHRTLATLPTALVLLTAQSLSCVPPASLCAEAFELRNAMVEEDMVPRDSEAKHDLRVLHAALGIGEAVDTPPMLSG